MYRLSDFDLPRSSNIFPPDADPASAAMCAEWAEIKEFVMGEEAEDENYDEVEADRHERLLQRTARLREFLGGTGRSSTGGGGSRR